MASPPATERQPGLPAALVVGAVVLLFYLLLSSSATLWDRDEPRFARATVEMIQSGNYLYPTFDGELRPDKPVLLYWLMSIPMRLAGQSEFAARLISNLGVVLAGVFTFLIGRRMYDGRVGLWAMVALCSSTLAIAEGNLATADGLLLCMITLTTWAIIDAIYTGVRRWHVVVMSLGFGLGMLAKGPPGLAMPVLTLLGAWWWGRREQVVRRPVILATALAAAVGSVIYLAWMIPVDIATDGRFVREFIGRHVVERALSPQEGHGGRGWKYLALLPIYIPILFAGFFPWTLHLATGIAAVLKRRLYATRERAILLGWTVPTFVLFSLVATKLPHYILPIWPGLAVGVAVIIEAARTKQLSDADIFHLSRGWYALVPVSGGAAIVLLVGPWLLPVTELRIPLAVLGIVAVMMTVMIPRHQAAMRIRQASVMAAGSMAIVLLVLSLVVLPVVETQKPAPHIAHAVRAAVPADVPIATHIFSEPSLRFYLDRGIIRDLGSNEAADALAVEWLTDPQPRVLITTREGFHRITRLAQQQAIQLAVDEIAWYKGFNYSKGHPLEVVALRSHGPTAQVQSPSGDTDAAASGP